MTLAWVPFSAEPQCPLVLVAEDDALLEIRFGFEAPAGMDRQETPVLRESLLQLRSYFARKLRTFEVPLRPAGTPFQQQVWKALLTVPYGQTRSYSDIAKQIGADKAVRAVGAANGRNPIPVMIPCHRVIGASGKLTGFGGGLPLKRFLLDGEQDPSASLF